MNNLFKLLIWPIVLVPLAYLAYVWPGLPDQVATHFNLQGNPDKFGSKNQLIYVLLLMTGISLAVFYLLPLAYKIVPKKTAAENKPRLRALAFFIAIFISFINCMI